MRPHSGTRSEELNKCGQKQICLLITHSGLLLTNWATAPIAGDWQLLVDEVPNSLVKSGSLRLSESWPLFDNWFRLEPDPDGADFSRVVDKDRENPISRHMRDDDALSKRISRVLAAWKRSAVVGVSIKEWSAAAGGQIQWSACSDLTFLTRFRKVCFLANEFDQSIPYKIISRHLEVDWEEIKIPPRSIPPSRRKVKICYFSEKTRASAYLFEGKSGKEILKYCFEKTENDFDGAQFFWSANNKVISSGLTIAGGVQCKPMVSGRNDLMDMSACAFFYSAKPNSGEAALFSRMYGITGPEIELARVSRRRSSSLWPDRRCATLIANGMWKSICSTRSRPRPSMTGYRGATGSIAK